MAQSFLNQSGLPLGLRNNNPGNLRPLGGGQKWLGEIERDTINNFSRFSDIAYGLRAMITDITGDIVVDGMDTIRKITSVYAPPSENDTTAYINAVASYTGWHPDQVITPNAANIEKLIRAKMKVELGAQAAGKVANSDISEGFDRLSDKVKDWLNLAPNGSEGDSGLLLGGLVLLIIFRKQLFG
jgi:hypothetical protein